MHRLLLYRNTSKRHFVNSYTGHGKQILINICIFYINILNIYMDFGNAASHLNIRIIIISI